MVAVDSKAGDVLFRRSAVPPFRRSAVPPFRRSAVPPFRRSSRLLIASVSLLAFSEARAEELDFSSCTTSPCPDQWMTGCLASDVWGDDDTISVCDGTNSSSGKLQGVYLLPSAGPFPTSIGFDVPTVSTASDGVVVVVRGMADSSSSTVSGQLRYYDSSDVLLKTDTFTVHTGSSGLFGYYGEWTTWPSGTAKFRARVAVTGDGAWITAFSADDTDLGDASPCEYMCPCGRPVVGVKEGGGDCSVDINDCPADCLEHPSCPVETEDPPTCPV